MPALNTGVRAPNIKLPALTGARFVLEDALTDHVVLVFLKVSCPTCQYALPFFERMHKQYGKDQVRFYGISQDDARNTSAFIREFGITFPMVLDDTKTYPASNAYGLTNVPTVFLVSPEGEIVFSSVSWVREDFDQLSAQLAKISGLDDVELFKAGEQVLDFKAG